MTRLTRTLMLWSPRTLAILCALGLAVFSLDVFTERVGFVRALGAFFLHSTPSLLLVLIVAVAWRREWVGAAVFIGFAALYTVFAVNWSLFVAAPLCVVSLLYYLSWRHHLELREGS